VDIAELVVRHRSVIDVLRILHLCARLLAPFAPT
jgi:hypothetical protein